MLGKLKALLGDKQVLPETLSSEDEQTILEEGGAAEKLALAVRVETRPEVLYYLAEGGSAEVRKAVAGNSSTPIQADELLKADEEADVRAELARKIARLLPTLQDAEQAQVEEKTIQLLNDLAQDQLPKIRALIADEVKTLEHVPKDVVTKLAQDVEDIVSAPILQYSPLLNDDDLREIVAAGLSTKALEAVASRAEVSEHLSADIAATLDVPAIAALLTNANAQIREDTLDQIIDQAESVEDLHQPLALRPQLSLRAMKRISGFVASALVFAMIKQSNISEEMGDELLEKVRQRLSFESVEDADAKAYAEKALDFFERSMLNDHFFAEQLSKNSREFIIHCFAVKADLTADTVRQVINSKSGRAVSALCWRAELSMRTAYDVQTSFALVPAAQILLPKDGKDYPISEDELEWHLSYFIDQA